MITIRAPGSPDPRPPPYHLSPLLVARQRPLYSAREQRARRAAVGWNVPPTAVTVAKIASTAAGRSTASSGRRSTAVAERRLWSVSRDGSAAAVLAESEPGGEAGSGEGKESSGAKSEAGESGLESGDEGSGAPSTSADAAHILGVESTPGTPALAAAGLAAGGDAGGVAWGEWGEWRYAVGGRLARAAGEAGRVVGTALPPESAVLLTACVVGLLTGASVSLFNEAVHAIRDTVWQGVPPAEGSTWLRSQSVAATWHLHIFVPLAGGVAVGILNTVRSEIKDLPLSAAQNLVAVLRPVLKAVAAAVTLGTGNSLGPEGPSVEIGASVGKGAGKVVQGGRERTIALVAAGSAAGISAGFNAAVAGCFFALESVLRSSVSSAPASLTTAMVLLSSVLAAVVSQQILGSDPAVQIPLYEFRSPAELPLYLLLGLCCGGVSIALTRSARLATHAFDRLLLLSPLPPALLPALGGLSVGVISLAYPEVLYWGFQNINDLLGSRPLASAPQVDFLLQLVAFKVVATAICRGSGLVGGFYAPSLFIGAALGQAYGRLASDVLVAVDPEYNLQWIQVAAPQAYAMVGMAATLAGVCQVPLTSVLLLFELTRDYRIILPLMAAVGIAAWIAAPATTPPSSPSPPAAAEAAAECTSGGDYTDFSDDSASLDVRDGVLLEEQVQRALPVSAAMRPASSPAVAAVPLMLVQPREYSRQGRGDGEAGYRPQASGVREEEYRAQERGGEEVESRPSFETSQKSESGGEEVEYRPSTVGEAVAAMVASRQWCCVVVGDGGRLEGLLTLVDVQQEVERRNFWALDFEAPSKKLSAVDASHMPLTPPLACLSILPPSHPLPSPPPSLPPLVPSLPLSHPLPSPPPSLPPLVPSLPLSHPLPSPPPSLPPLVPSLPLSSL
ncbi:unnamed protein product [Closterium sp. Yama58-4]|nr:unnamed protein product [Closterium sp. Yama58-4]